MYYFPTSLGRAYVDGTNLRMSYCQFPTVWSGPAARASRAGIRRRRHSSRTKCWIARSARGRVRSSLLRSSGARLPTLAACGMVLVTGGARFADARSMRDGLVTGGDCRRSQHAGRSGYGRRLATLAACDTVWLRVARDWPTLAACGTVLVTGHRRRSSAQEQPIRWRSGGRLLHSDHGSAFGFVADARGMQGGLATGGAIGRRSRQGGSSRRGRRAIWGISVQ
jgi:hypothetical protein